MSEVTEKALSVLDSMLTKYRLEASERAAIAFAISVIRANRKELEDEEKGVVLN